MPLSPAARQQLLNGLDGIAVPAAGPDPELAPDDEYEAALRSTVERQDVKQRIAEEVIGPSVRMLAELVHACREAIVKGDVVYLESALEEAEALLDELTE